MYFAPSRRAEARISLRGDSNWSIKVFPKHKRSFLQQKEQLSFKRVFKRGQLVLGLASGLEAFSREPPCDSIGALAVRQTPETSGMAWEFLSYYPKLPSRCLRDPLCYLGKEKEKKILFFFWIKSCRIVKPSNTTLRRPKHSPRTIALGNYNSRNSQLSRVKPTCLTTV